jgi:hypothetical protein
LPLLFRVPGRTRTLSTRCIFNTILGLDFFGLALSRPQSPTSQQRLRRTLPSSRTRLAVGESVIKR